MSAACERTALDSIAIGVPTPKGPRQCLATQPHFDPRLTFRRRFQQVAQDPGRLFLPSSDASDGPNPGLASTVLQEKTTTGKPLAKRAPPTMPLAWGPGVIALEFVLTCLVPKAGWLLGRVRGFKP